MNIDCKEIESKTSINIEVVPIEQGGTATIIFTNEAGHQLWFPFEAEPAYRMDRDSGYLYIWIGYFDEIYGKYSDKYMVPELKPVEPGKQVKLVLNSHELTQIYLQHAIPVQIQARISTMAIEQSNVRGSQPLPEYLQNSCVVKWPVFTLENQPAQQGD